MSQKAKSQISTDSPELFLASIADPQRQADAVALSRWITDLTGESPRMWGPAILGWGTRQVQYADGHTETWLRLGFSPRKAELAVYGLKGLGGVEADVSHLGKVKTGRGCVWIRKLSDVHRPALEQAIVQVWAGN